MEWRNSNECCGLAMTKGLIKSFDTTGEMLGTGPASRLIPVASLLSLPSSISQPKATVLRCLHVCIIKETNYVSFILTVHEIAAIRNGP